MVGDLLLGLLAGALVAAVTTPVGVSGAVFLLPIQLSVLQVPNPSVTPTNLLYNVIAAPGALFRYRRTGHATGALARRLLVGTVPGVVVGAVVRVFLLPDARSFRVIAGVVLLIIGGWLLKRTLAPPSKVTPWPSRRLVAVAFAVGIVGGVYGVGGGSLLSPLLVGSGMAVAAVAPAALASTFVTSVVGALSYGALSLFADGSIAPDWPLGIACGLGGLVGGYVGALLQPRVPERGLRYLLGGLAAVIGIGYLVQGLG